jgi:hypothetical protein
VTEAEWLACDDPAPMLEFLRASGNVSERKLRLFACAWCRRRGWDGHRDWYVIEVAVNAAEKYADGAILSDRFAAAGEKLRIYGLDRATSEETQVADRIMALEAWEAALAAIRAEDRLPDSAALLREVFGNLTYKVSIATSSLRWNDWTVVDIAQAIYNDRAFDRLPILADALEDAGCTDAELLGHLRGPGPHVRGCWALDLLLTKERVVTEGEWLAANDPGPMLDFVERGDRICGQKYALFAIACCRRIWRLPPDARR